MRTCPYCGVLADDPDVTRHVCDPEAEDAVEADAREMFLEPIVKDPATDIARALKVRPVWQQR